MKTAYSVTVKESTVVAYVRDTKNKSNFQKSYMLPYAVDTESAEKPVEKLVKAEGLRLIDIDSVTVKNVKCELPIAIVKRHAVSLSRRGENGRTREPVFTRTLESSVIVALVRDKARKSNFQKSYMLPYAVDTESAEKPVEKLVKAEGLRLIDIDSVTVKTEVLELKLAEFVKLAHTCGTVTEVSDTDTDTDTEN